MKTILIAAILIAATLLAIWVFREAQYLKRGGK